MVPEIPVFFGRDSKKKPEIINLMINIKISKYHHNVTLYIYLFFDEQLTPQIEI